VNESDAAVAQPEVAIPETFPWPPREGESSLEALVDTWKEACFNATSFFRRMPRADHYGSVLVYYLIIGVVGAGVELFWSSVFGTLGLRDLILRHLPAEASVRTETGVVDFLLSPLFLLLTLFVLSGITHVILLMMRGAKHGFVTTTRVFAFSYSPQLLSVVPVLGGLVGFVWMVALAIVGLREAHETDGAKAAVAVLVPIFLLVGLIVLGILIALAVGVLDTRI
jgi:hypothetical protein